MSKLNPALVSKMKHVCLSLRFGDHMKAFRGAVRRVAMDEKKVVIVRIGRPR